MPTRPRLIRSIPFWGLVVVSLATIAGGWYITSDRLGTMTTTLTAGTATGIDVYVGQSIAQLGAILIGAGVIGVLLALGVAAVATPRPHAPVDAAEPIDWESEAENLEAETASAEAGPAEAGTAADAETAQTAKAEAEASVPTR